MKPRNTLIVVGLFALLLGYVYFVELNKTPEQLGAPTPAARQYIFQLAARDAQSLEVRDLRDGREVKTVRFENGWRIVKPIEKAADNFKVDSALDQVVTLQANRVLTNVTDLAPFGFITATLEVRVVMSDTTPYAITIGDKTPDGSNYYAVYTGSKQPVFIVSTFSLDGLKAWLETPPYEPTPTPTFTPTPPVTPTIAPTETLTMTMTPSAETPTVAPPNIAPTIALPTPAATPKP